MHGRSRMTIKTLASLQCRDGARRVFTDQVDIASTKRRGHTHFLLALVICPFTTHPFRDGTPFLLLVETHPAFGRSLRFVRILRKKRFAYLIPFLFRLLWPPSTS